MTCFSTTFKNIRENLTIFSFLCIIFRGCMFFLGVLFIGIWKKLKKTLLPRNFITFFGFFHNKTSHFSDIFNTFFRFLWEFTIQKKKSAWLFQKTSQVSSCHRSEDRSVESVDSKFQVFQKLWPNLWNWVSFEVKKFKMLQKFPKKIWDVFGHV